MKKKPTTAAAVINGKYSVPVVRSTFRILELLSRNDLMGLKEITHETGVPKSTVFRILNTLLEMGYVVRDANRDYRISFTLGRLVSDQAAGEALRRIAQPYMLDLRDKFGETVNLGVRNFDKMIYLEVVPSEFALRLQEKRGATVPIHASALGKALLAFSAPELVEQLLRAHKLEAVTHNTIVDPDALITDVKRVRSLGYAFDRGEGSMLAICVGAPIIDSNGTAIAAMSISGPATRFNPRKGSPVISALLKATNDVSRQFAQLVPKWEKSAAVADRKR